MNPQTEPSRRDAVDEVLAQLDKEMWLADMDADSFTMTSVPTGLQPETLSRTVTVQTPEPPPKKRIGWGRILLRSLVCVVVFSLILSFFAAATVTVVCLGPSETVRTDFVRFAVSNRYLSFIARLYFSSDRINEMLQPAAPALDPPDVSDPPPAPQTPALYTEKISGTGYTGLLLTVTDATRIAVVSIETFSKNTDGALLTDLSAQYAAAVSGGLFYDPRQKGSGGMPEGLVIQNGDLRLSSSETTVVGFSENGQMTLANLTAAQAQQLDLIHAVSAQAALIVNGELKSVNVDTVADARTLIGQKADGTVFFAVINGRTPNSPGATVTQAQQLMHQLGAVNAALLNSGGSCAMVYDGQLISGESSQLPRRIPTAFVIGGAV